MYNFSSITLNITQGCNLRCKYCQVNKNPKVMSKEVLDKALTWITNNINNPYVSFFGGEPLTKFDLIKYAVEKYPNIGYGASTNLTLMDKEKIKFFFDHDFHFLFSIDGVGEVHNLTRDNSWNQIVNKLPIVAELFPKAVFRITITADNVQNLYETVLFASNLGFTVVQALPDGLDDKWTEENYLILKKELQKLYQNPLTRDIFKTFYDYKYRLNNPKSSFTCCDGRTSISILTDGRFSLCGEQTEDSPFIIGNLDEGINDNKIKNFWSFYKECPLNCFAKNICSQERCFSRRWFNYHDLSHKINNHCRWYQYIAEVINDAKPE